jgi:hypothetical protein
MSKLAGTDEQHLTEFGNQLQAVIKITERLSFMLIFITTSVSLKNT